jgi:16S rRNA (uracil1498-N3)-methyltransferase
VNLFYQPQIPDGVHYLDEDESRHCVKVLRREVGDEIRITDGKGSFYTCRITKADPRACTFQIQSTTKEKSRSFAIHIAIAPTKNPDRIEWFTEKAVEFGVDTITLMHCDHSEKSFLKTERLNKMAISAMKQSLKASLPIINPPTPFSDVVRNEKCAGKFIACVDQSNPVHLKDVAQKNESSIILIGPEGDFSPAELDLARSMDFKKVSLGNSRLRTETAGLAACHILNLVNG